MDKQALYPSDDGATGGISSPDCAISPWTGCRVLLRRHLISSRQKVNLVRYADDFIITGASREVLGNRLRHALRWVCINGRGIHLARMDGHHAHRTGL